MEEHLAPIAIFVLDAGISLAALSRFRWCDIHEAYFTISQTIYRKRNADEDDPRCTSLQRDASSENWQEC